MSSIGRVVKENYSGLYWCTRHYTKGKRQAIHTLYALVKHFDDLCSSSISANEKKEIIKAWEREIDNIYDKKVPVTEIGRRVYKDCMRFKLLKERFENIITSLQSDCPNPINRPTQKELNQYCQGIAITPTYLILKVIAEFDDETNDKLATQIGQAIEITNILKNTKEDMSLGHVYIPEEFLAEAEIEKTLTPKEVLTHTNLYVARQKLADIARKAFAESYRLLEENNNTNSKPVIYVLNLYQKYFEIMDNRGWEIISPKPKLKLKDNLLLVAKTMLGKGY